jgi:hypothetical protein
MEFHGHCKVVAGTLKSRIIPSAGLSLSINFIIQRSIKSVTEHFDIYFSKAKLHSQNYTVLELISLLGTLVVLLVPLYQPVLGIILRPPRVLGGQRLRFRGE